MKTLPSSSYNPDWLRYNGALLNMPLPTIIDRIENGEVDLNKRFKTNNDTIWHILAKGDEKKHTDKLSAIIIKYFNNINLADLNSLNDRNLTPIQIAALHGNTETIDVLVSLGVDPTKPCLSEICPYGTLYDLIKKSGRSGCMVRLREIMERYKGIQELKNQQPTERPFIERNTLPAHAVNKNLRNSFGRSVYKACRQILFNKEQTIQQDETEPSYPITPDDSQRPLIEKKLL